MTSYLTADSIWWNGAFSPATGLRLDPDGTVRPTQEIPSGAPVRKLPGTLLPGLVDTHVHSALVDLATLRAGGLSAVWDLGGVPTTVAALARLQKGDLPAETTGPISTQAGGGVPLAARGGRMSIPRLRYAGPFLIPPGGYPSDRAWAPPGSWREVHSPTDAAEALAEVQACGATLVKVTANAATSLLPPPTLAALVSAAHNAGLPVVVHAEGPGTVAAALTAGADWLAHTPWTESLDPALTRDCAARMTWISTLDIHGWGTPTPAHETAIANLRHFLAAGGRVRYGTDLGNGPLPPGVNAREIRALQAADLTPADILTAMTDHQDVTWIPGGLDLDPAHFPDVLATARVVDASVQPRY